MLKKGALAVSILAVALFAAWHGSPWPSALFFRAVMDRSGVAMHAALAKHVPERVEERLNLAYMDDDRTARLDVFRPAGASDKALPVVVWVHGGGFLSGSKDQVANYLRIIAGRGYAVVGVDYALAPGARYPGPVRQISSALGYLAANAGSLGLDTTRVFLAGDSAGAQIAGQVAGLLVFPDRAAKLDIAPPLPRTALRGVILHCGLHALETIKSDGAFGGFITSAMWSYFGVTSLAGDPRAAEASTVRTVEAGFPPMFVSVGNADPLRSQSKALQEVAAARGLVVDALFFPEDYTPPLAHEYQFDLDTAAGRLALERTLTFLERYAR